MEILQAIAEFGVSVGIALIMIYAMKYVYDKEREDRRYILDKLLEEQNKDKKE